MRHPGLCAAALLLVGCGKMVPLHPRTVAVTQTDNPQAVRAAIQRALPRQSFELVSEVPGKITARHDRRGRRCTMIIDYDARHYTIHHATSSFDQKAGQIDSRYMRMTNRMVKMIDDEIGRPAREAAAAQERERQHQLAVEAERRRAEEAALEAERLRHEPPPPPPRHHHRPMVVVPLPTPQPQVYERRTQVRQRSESRRCCINGSAYTCPDEQSFQSCVTLQPHSCAPAGRCN